MNWKTQFLGIVLSLPLSVLGQGTFQNLDFEASTVPPLANGQPGSSVSVEAAFPNWVAYWGADVAPYVFHNDYALGAPSLSILGPSGWPVFEGRFTAVIQAGRLPPSLEVYPAALAQIGTVPAGIQSIMFYSGFTRPEVTFNSERIPVALLGTGVSGTGTAYEILGGDISSFAGQIGELRFSSYAVEGQLGSLTLIDNIFFSTQQIPEPGPLGLIGLGTLLVAWRLRQGGTS